jgi:hypothetical protein
VGQEPAPQSDAAGQHPGRQVDLQRVGMAVPAGVGRQHPGQLRMHPVGCGALGRKPGLPLLSRPFQPNLVEGEEAVPGEWRRRPRSCKSSASSAAGARSNWGGPRAGACRNTSCSSCSLCSKPWGRPMPSADRARCHNPSQ